MMKIVHETLQTLSDPPGMVVVIDVIRAFTAAAFAFGGGAESIILAGTTDEARLLKERNRGALLMGEDGGYRPEGFDFGNSPHELTGADLRGRTIVQRTSRGTQGIVRSRRADTLIAASFVCAGATARYIASSSQARVTFVNTGADQSGFGDEDASCAEYIHELVNGNRPDPEPYLDRVRECTISTKVFADPKKTAFPWADIELCTDLDRFGFAMVVRDEDGNRVMRAHPVATV